MNERLDSLGETALIRRLTAGLTSGKHVRVGPGDDCAVVALSGGKEDLVLTSDPVIEGRHFRAETSPRQIGHKAVGRVLSDLAAMGAIPRWGLVNVVAPPDMDIRVLEEVYDGMRALADTHHFAIIGGDVAQGKPLSLHVFGTGSVPAGRARLRSGATPGQAIYVTGVLGGSLMGKHLSFEPRVSEGVWLLDWATAMIDLSDGLATDLRHLCESSGIGARIQLDDIPISAAASSRGDDCTPVQHALEDGEDFELLFTIPDERSTAFEAAWSTYTKLRCTRIGKTMQAEGGVVSVARTGEEQRLENRGYDHFAG